MNIELEKKKLEKKKVILAKDEMEFKILERMADIERLKENILIQEGRVKELDQMINDLSKEQ